MAVAVLIVAVFCCSIATALRAADFDVLHGQPGAPGLSSLPCGRGPLDPHSDQPIWVEHGKAKGERFVGLFNPLDHPATFKLRFEDIGLPEEAPSSQYAVVNLSNNRTEVQHPLGSFGLTLDKNSAILLYVQGDGHKPGPHLRHKFAWVRPVSVNSTTGAQACVALFNIANRPLKFDLSFKDIGLPDEKPAELEYSVREELHGNKTMPHPPGSFGVNLIPWSAALLHINRIHSGPEAAVRAIATSRPAVSRRNTTATCALSEISLKSLQVLQSSWYDDSSGLWETADWWEDANSIEALCNAVDLCPSSEPLVARIAAAISNTFARTTINQTLTGRYDDEGWWALAWLRAHDIVGDDLYLQRAEQIFDDLADNAWDKTCGGGVWWSYYKQYKNAITNELFWMMALRLYQKTGSAKYQSWAEKIGKWFVSSGMINDHHTVNDGLVTSTCKNNNQTVWTYNQGVVLGGLVDHAVLFKNTSMIELAGDIAVAAAQTLTYPSGVLRESCEVDGGCDEDQKQFKGILMRYLMYTWAALGSLVPNHFLQDFVTINAEAIQASDLNKADGDLGLTWIGPAPPEQPSGPVVQTSALEAFLLSDTVSAATASKSRTTPTDAVYI
eukprot:gnl/TRDRNA2_/TRDRNA2_163200_c0_seq4.p1 gnl/TRDRNA2_/TRDRNA2_163200_c0~~gnl/TRDRNA2_/TRDRNA2_163200_c0_seq4.p1  ORF type:complete len:636 (-),score=106.85 gnl/TRDRNA2_/TRDRNA2_163200_c0_seq4:44-1885(-)